MRTLHHKKSQAKAHFCSNRARAILFHVFHVYKSTNKSTNMAALTIAFKSALERIGFNASTQESIVYQGFASINSLADVDEEHISGMIKHLGHWPGPAPVAPAPAVAFPYLSVQKLRAMRYWVLGRRRLGKTTAAVHFTNMIAMEMLAEMQEEKMIMKAAAESKPSKPTEFKDFTKWRKFEELFLTYLGCVRGAGKIPLAYVVRSHTIVTPEIEAETYDTREERLVATIVLDGEHYAIDNKAIYDELKPLIVNGPGWSFAKKFDKKKDGRGAFLALKLQAEGSSAQLTRKSEAYAKIKNAGYRGERRQHTFADFVRVHQDAHNDLADLGEPVPVTKQVTDMLAGINDPRLQTGIDVVLGDPEKLADFDACQQYLGTLVQNMATQAQHSRDRGRNVSATEKGNGSIAAKRYTPDEWYALSDAEKDKVRELRKKARKGDSKFKRRKAAAAKSRKAAKVQREKNKREEDEDDADEDDSHDTAEANAGHQFGSGAHKKQRTKK
jgi:hypothetical protein